MRTATFPWSSRRYAAPATIHRIAGAKTAMLGDAGVVVAPSNADAATVAAEIVNHVDHLNRRHGC